VHPNGKSILNLASFELVALGYIEDVEHDLLYTPLQLNMWNGKTGAELSSTTTAELADGLSPAGSYPPHVTGLRRQNSGSGS
jgi:hypothetical protein